MGMYHVIWANPVPYGFLNNFNGLHHRSCSALLLEIKALDVATRGLMSAASQTELIGMYGLIWSYPIVCHQKTWYDVGMTTLKGGKVQWRLVSSKGRLMECG